MANKEDKGNIAKELAKTRMEKENNRNIEKQAEDITILRKEMTSLLGETVNEFKDPRPIKTINPNQFISGKRQSQGDYLSAKETFYAKRRDDEAEKEEADAPKNKKKQLKKEENAAKQLKKNLTEILGIHRIELNKDAIARNNKNMRFNTAEAVEQHENDEENTSDVVEEVKSNTEEANVVEEKRVDYFAKDKLAAQRLAQLEMKRKEAEEKEENKRENMWFATRIAKDKAYDPVKNFYDTFGEWIPYLGEYIKEQRELNKKHKETNDVILNQMMDNSTTNENDLPEYVNMLTKLFESRDYDMENFKSERDKEILREIYKNQEFFESNFRKEYGETISEFNTIKEGKDERKEKLSLEELEQYEEIISYTERTNDLLKKILTSEDEANINAKDLKKEERIAENHKEMREDKRDSIFDKIESALTLISKKGVKGTKGTKKTKPTEEDDAMMGGFMGYLLGKSGIIGKLLTGAGLTGLIATAGVAALLVIKGLVIGGLFYGAYKGVESIVNSAVTTAEEALGHAPDMSEIFSGFVANLVTFGAEVMNWTGWFDQIDIAPIEELVKKFERWGAKISGVFGFESAESHKEEQAKLKKKALAREAKRIAVIERHESDRKFDHQQQVMSIEKKRTDLYLAQGETENEKLTRIAKGTNNTELLKVVNKRIGPQTPEEKKLSEDKAEKMAEQVQQKLDIWIKANIDNKTLIQMKIDAENKALKSKELLKGDTKPTILENVSTTKELKGLDVTGDTVPTVAKKAIKPTKPTKPTKSGTDEMVEYVDDWGDIQKERVVMKYGYKLPATIAKTIVDSEDAYEEHQDFINNKLIKPGKASQTPITSQSGELPSYETINKGKKKFRDMLKTEFASREPGALVNNKGESVNKIEESTYYKKPTFNKPSANRRANRAAEMRRKADIVKAEAIKRGIDPNNVVANYKNGVLVDIRPVGDKPTKGTKPNLVTSSPTSSFPNQTLEQTFNNAVTQSQSAGTPREVIDKVKNQRGPLQNVKAAVGSYITANANGLESSNYKPQNATEEKIVDDEIKVTVDEITAKLSPEEKSRFDKLTKGLGSENTQMEILKVLKSIENGNKEDAVKVGKKEKDNERKSDIKESKEKSKKGIIKDKDGNIITPEAKVKDEETDTSWWDNMGGDFKERAMKVWSGIKTSAGGLFGKTGMLTKSGGSTRTPYSGGRPYKTHGGNYSGPEDKYNNFKQLDSNATIAAKESGLPKDFIIAQQLQENGWDKKALTGKNNFFNIKADSSWDGPKSLHKVWEVINGQNVMQDAWFRDYEDPTQSAKDYAKFLKENPRYGNLLGKNLSSDQAADEMQRAGYATDPNYATNIKRIMRGKTFQKMQNRIESEGPTAPSAPTAPTVSEVSNAIESSGTPDVTSTGAYSYNPTVVGGPNIPNKSSMPNQAWSGTFGTNGMSGTTTQSNLTTTGTDVSSGNVSGSNTIDFARQFKGKFGYSQAYRNRNVGGTNYLDCSSFVQRVIKGTGIDENFPATTATQIPYLMKKQATEPNVIKQLSSVNELTTGDLIYFGTVRGSSRHVVMMASPSTIIHSSSKHNNVVEVPSSYIQNSSKPVSYMFRYIGKGHSAELSQSEAQGQVTSAMNFAGGPGVGGAGPGGMPSGITNPLAMASSISGLAGSSLSNGNGQGIISQDGIRSLDTLIPNASKLLGKTGLSGGIGQLGDIITKITGSNGSGIAQLFNPKTSMIMNQLSTNKQMFNANSATSHGNMINALGSMGSSISNSIGHFQTEAHAYKTRPDSDPMKSLGFISWLK